MTQSFAKNGRPTYDPELSASAATWANLYLKHGWKLTIVPEGTKGSLVPGWNRPERTLQTAMDLPTRDGIGLLHAYSGTMAMDIDDWESAARELALSGVHVAAMVDDSETVRIESGIAGRAKLLYAMPPGIVLPTVKIKHPERTIYELRCGTMHRRSVQEVLPPSLHPLTGEPYRWTGRGNWRRLPEVPPPLLGLWRHILRNNER